MLVKGATGSRYVRWHRIWQNQVPEYNMNTNEIQEDQNFRQFVQLTKFLFSLNFPKVEIFQTIDQI